MNAHVHPPGGFTEEEWAAASSFPDYLASLEEKRDLWETYVRRSAVDDLSHSRLVALPGPRRVLVLTEGASPQSWHSCGHLPGGGYGLSAR